MTVARTDAPYDVFVSYSDADRDFAHRLYDALRRSKFLRRRLRVFFAPAAITVGESIPAAISQALDRSGCLVAVVTPAWLASEWSRLESDVAVWRDPAANHRLLLPLLLKTTAMPTLLSRIKYLDVREGRDLEEIMPDLIAAIRWSAAEAEERSQAAAERRDVLAAPILPWLGFGGPSFDFVWPEMIIDPSVSPLRHPGSDARLSNWLTSARTEAACFAVVGVAGAGKTTALRSLMLSGGGDLPSQRVFVHARDLPARASELATRSRRMARLALLVDGLDEAGEGLVETVSSHLGQLAAAGATIFFAARTDFFDRQSDILKRTLGMPREVLEVKSWTREDVLDFASGYAQRISDPSVSARAESIIDDVPGAAQMSSNPMRLTLLLYLLASDAAIDVVRLSEPYALYTMFYREWLTRERHRGTGGIDSSLVQKSHTALARWFYTNRGERARPEESIGADVWMALRTDSAFTELLDTAAGWGDESESIRGFRHETIGEFLIAQSVLDAFLAGGPAIDAALTVTVGDDVNSFVRSGLTDLGAARVSVIQQNLAARYDELEADSAGRDTDRSERLREQIIYYVGRLPVDEAPPMLVRAFTTESSPLLRRSAALGAILHGDDDAEIEYMALLDDPGEASLNRSVQMVYFGDVHGDLHTFVDGGQGWSKTRAAILRRLGGHSLRDRRLRWWDLKTLRSFLEARPGDTLSSAELAVVHGIDTAAEGGSERELAVGREVRLIDELVRGRPT
ncbi:toll/interleukin-1 receptor domain-containing protein [Micromonospora taraxaci]|uniref:TIR domain-containing protein n=1 Tax=Micromonospora taraxaci TaxID=1316803 RepID=UPI003406252E